MNRRRFLQGLGAGAAASAFSLGPGRIGGALAAAKDPSPATLAARADLSGLFGRMFPRLPPFAAPSTALTDALMDIGRPGGVLDANDDLSAGPVALIVDPRLSINNPNNPSQTAGSTFMGQFFDHDVTFDSSSALDFPTDPGRSKNGRTPRLDLDSVYGSGPVASSYLYEPADRAKLRLEDGGSFEDLPRTRK